MRTQAFDQGFICRSTTRDPTQMERVRTRKTERRGKGWRGRGVNGGRVGKGGGGGSLPQPKQIREVLVSLDKVERKKKLYETTTRNPFRRLI